MTRLTRFAALFATSCLALSTPVIAQTANDDARFEAAQRRFQNELQIFNTEFQRYQSARQSSYRDPRYNNDPRYQQNRYADDRDENGYDAARYYRNDPRYQERVLGPDDRVYRGNDGQYYCKRNDGTTGLIVGAISGGVLGNAIDGGHSRAAGTLLGGALGAIVGKSIDQNSQPIRCR